jgi:lactate dehydrogenase-like 2-hydroxyacid dehydrogenase
MTESNLRGKVLLAGEFPDSSRQTLETYFDVVGPLEGTFEDSVTTLPSSIARAVRAIVTTANVSIGQRTIQTLPSLGLISCRGSGYEGVDVHAARERGIAVTHTPGVSASSVADIAMGLLIASVRRMSLAQRCVEQGRWRDVTIHNCLRVRGLTGRRLGVYGLGAIGAKIAQRASAFEMEVGYHNRRARSDVPYRYFPTLIQLASWADVLAIAVRAGPETRHRVDKTILSALGKDGFVINISRGSVIDEKALVDALSSGVIAGAGLDVLEDEAGISPTLLSMPSVALTPHIGSDTQEVQEASLRMVLANLDAFFSGRPLLTPIPAKKI